MLLVESETVQPGHPGRALDPGSNAFHYNHRSTFPDCSQLMGIQQTTGHQPLATDLQLTPGTSALAKTEISDRSHNDQEKEEEGLPLCRLRDAAKTLPHRHARRLRRD